MSLSFITVYFPSVTFPSGWHNVPFSTTLFEQQRAFCFALFYRANVQKVYAPSGGVYSCFLLLLPLISLFELSLERKKKWITLVSNAASGPAFKASNALKMKSVYTDKATDIYVLAFHNCVRYGSPVTDFRELGLGSSSLEYRLHDAGKVCDIANQIWRAFLNPSRRAPLHFIAQEEGGFRTEIHVSEEFVITFHKSWNPKNCCGFCGKGGKAKWH